MAGSVTSELRQPCCEDAIEIDDQGDGGKVRLWRRLESSVYRGRGKREDAK